MLDCVSCLLHEKAFRNVKRRTVDEIDEMFTNEKEADFHLGPNECVWTQR